MFPEPEKCPFCLEPTLDTYTHRYRSGDGLLMERQLHIPCLLKQLCKDGMCFCPTTNTPLDVPGIIQLFTPRLLKMVNEEQVAAAPGFPICDNDEALQARQLERLKVRVTSVLPALPNVLGAVEESAGFMRSDYEKDAFHDRDSPWQSTWLTGTGRFNLSGALNLLGHPSGYVPTNKFRRWNLGFQNCGNGQWVERGEESMSFFVDVPNQGVDDMVTPMPPFQMQPLCAHKVEAMERRARGDSDQGGRSPTIAFHGDPSWERCDTLLKHMAGPRGFPWLSSTLSSAAGEGGAMIEARFHSLLRAVPLLVRAIALERHCPEEECMQIAARAFSYIINAMFLIKQRCVALHTTGGYIPNVVLPEHPIPAANLPPRAIPAGSDEHGDGSDEHHPMVLGDEE